MSKKPLQHIKPEDYAFQRLILVFLPLYLAASVAFLHSFAGCSSSLRGIMTLAVLDFV